MFARYSVENCLNPVASEWGTFLFLKYRRFFLKFTVESLNIICKVKIVEILFINYKFYIMLWNRNEDIL